MTTNIGVLAKTILSGSFFITANSDWRDYITFYQPPPNQLQPLDLTGVAFYAQVRLAIGNPLILLDLSTDNGLLINGGPSGTLTWAVPTRRPSAAPFYYTAMLAALATSQTPLVMDLVAMADGQQINLFSRAPATIVLERGVTTL